MVRTPRQASDTPPPPTELVMIVEELANYLQLSKSSPYEHDQDGRVPGQKIGRHLRFHKSAIDDWLRSSQPSKSFRVVREGPMR